MEHDVCGTHRPWQTPGLEILAVPPFQVPSPSRGSFALPPAAAPPSNECNKRAEPGIVVLVNRSFGLIKNHQGSKRKDFPGAGAGRRAPSRGESCHPRELLRTVFNHFSSYFWVVHFTSSCHLCAGTHPAASLVFSRQGEPPIKATLPCCRL